MKPELQLAKDYFEKGILFLKEKKLVEAEIEFRMANRYAPNRGSVLTNLAATLIEQAKWDEAEFFCKELLKLEPEDLEGLLNLGICQLNKNDFLSAQNAFSLAATLYPQSSSAWANKGSLLLEQLQLTDAESSLEQALLIDDKCETALIGMGNLCNEKKLYEEGIRYFTEVLKLNPHNPRAMWNKALSLLRLGKFKEGWMLYEARWSINEMKQNLRDLHTPLWLGKQSLLGKTIFIYCEQGFGDALQMSRYLPLLEKELGAMVIFETPECLTELMKSLSPSIKVIQRGSYSDAEIISQIDFQCPIMSLPLAFGTSLETIPNNVPYLSAHPVKCNSWADTLQGISKHQSNGRSKLFRIGIAWSGSGHYAGKMNTKRDLSASTVASLLNMFATESVEFHVIQKDIEPKYSSCEVENLFFHNKKLLNFSDTAALMSNLDLILTVDTAVGHLAGALGLNTILLIPDPPDFMSLTNTISSPWYPNTSMLRQSSRGQWALGDIKLAIKDFFCSR